MCGIAGIARLHDQAVPPEGVLRRMVSAIRHRGPDGEGYYTDSAIGLGHARLSIIDLEGGRQPIQNEDGTVWVSYNGEIFNYLELRRELQARGHRFRTRTDTEVLVHLYEEVGERLVDRLNGQFAFALWDARARRLLLARDRSGILPLFYTVNDEECLFASEIKALLASGGVDARPDPVGLDQVLTVWSPLPPRTMFSGVSQVCPGEMVVVENGKVRRKQYWDWAFPPAGELATGQEDELAAELLAILEDATRVRLRADVPVGAYLSGGLDSSSLVALIQRSGTSDLRTFSIGFEDRKLDETGHQDELVRWLGTHHCSIECKEAEIAAQFLDTVWHTEVPILRTSPTPMRMLSGLVREQKLKVVLTGEGADEVLGGYDLFKEARIRRFWARNPESKWRPALLKRLYPYLDFSGKQSQAYLKAFFGKGIESPDAPWFSHLPRWHVTSQIKLFYSDEMRRTCAGNDLDSLPEILPEGWTAWHPFNRAEYLEAKTLLPGYILSSQGDRMLMANSVEGRFPFLDHRLIEFANRLHPKHKMRGLKEKALLKRAMRPFLPASIVSRYKQPYRGPGAATFAGERGADLASTLLSPHRLAEAGFFNVNAVERLRKKVARSSALGERDNMAYIGILAAQAWHYWFVEGEWSRTASRASDEWNQATGGI